MIEHSIKKNIRVADDCISVIAGISATNVDGVVGLSAGVNKSVLPFLATKNLKQGVNVKKTDEGLVVNIALSIKNGQDIQAISYNVQEKVKEALESMLDLNVKAVKIEIVGMSNNE